MQIKIFSTYVEVIPRYSTRPYPHEYFLHVCGGDPNGGNGDQSGVEFSPRMWR